jgi:hypothetical protein
MKNKEQKLQPVVTYLKVSPYLKSWIECKYGRIISFQPMTQAHVSLSRYIVNNVSMVNLTDFAYSDAAFNYQSKNSFFACTPSDEDRNQFIAIELPKNVWRGFNNVETNRYWQLSKSGAVEMRRIIKNEFMMELFKFIDDCFTRARINGTRTGREQAVDDFITMYDIDMSWRETLIRYDQRDRKKMLQAIEEHREQIEKLYDRQFCYT